MMEEKGIFINKVYPENESINFKIGYFAIELETCEKLLVMGYVSSNGVNIAKRAEYLEKRIKELEDQKAALNRRYETAKKFSVGFLSDEMIRLASAIGFVF
jgi:hypothetical protein